MIKLIDNSTIEKSYNRKSIEKIIIDEKEAKSEQTFVFENCTIDELDISVVKNNNITLNFKNCIIKNCTISGTDFDINDVLILQSTNLDDIKINANKCVTFTINSSNNFKNIEINSPKINGFNVYAGIKTPSGDITLKKTKEITNSHIVCETLEFPEELNRIRDTRLECALLNFKCKNCNILASDDNLEGKIEKIHFLSSVKSLCEEAFLGVRVDEVEFDESIQSIVATLFDDNTKLVGSFPDSITSFRKAFLPICGNDINSKMGYPKCVENINGYYMLGSTLIDVDPKIIEDKKLLILPDFIETIGNTAFSYLESVIVVGNNVTKIEDYGFMNVAGSPELIFPNLEYFGNCFGAFPGANLYTNVKDITCNDERAEIYTVDDIDVEILDSNKLMEELTQNGCTFSDINSFFKILNAQPFYIPALLETTKKNNLDFKTCLYEIIKSDSFTFSTSKTINYIDEER